MFAAGAVDMARFAVRWIFFGLGFRAVIVVTAGAVDVTRQAVRWIGPAGVGRIVSGVIVAVILPMVMPMIVVASGAMNMAVVVRFRIDEGSVQLPLDGKRDFACAVFVFGQHGHDFGTNAQIIDGTEIVTAHAALAIKNHKRGRAL